MQPTQNLPAERGGAAVCLAGEEENPTTFQPLSPQYVTFERRTSYVGYGIAALVAALVAVAIAISLWSWLATLVLGLLWLALCGLFGWAAHFWPPLRARHISWRLTEEGMEIRTGVWWRHRIAIPVARVQHVDVSQGPIQRLFDLGTLEIHTAGTKNASVQLEGLEYSRALHVRDQLIAQKESLHDG